MLVMKTVFSKFFFFMFGAGFFGFGIYIFSTTAAPTFKDWYAMKSWQPVWAELTEVKGADNRTEAVYQYQVKGKWYTGTRVYTAAFNDNIGSYHETLQTFLHQAERSKKPITIYHHPLDPNQAVIDREMRWGLFALMTGFCLVFILVGAAISYAGLRHVPEPAVPMPSTAELRKEWEAKKQDPDYKEDFLDFLKFKKHEVKQQASPADSTPKGHWQDKTEWQTHAIRSDAKTNVNTYWFLAVACLAVSSPVFFVFSEEWQSQNYAILLGLIFPLIGLFLMGKAILLTKAYRKFGIIEYQMDPYPGAVGGQVGGWLDLSRNFDINADYHIRLECVFSYMSGTGEDRTRRETIKWSEKGTADTEYAQNRLRLLFVFDIPDDLPESDIEQTDDYYFWRLGLNADMQGINLDRTYNIPVMKTGEMSKTDAVNLSRQMKSAALKADRETKRHLKQGKYHLTDLSKTAVISDTPLKLELYFPMFGNKVLTLYAFIFGACFSGLSYGLIQAIDNFGVFDLIMGIIAFPFTLLALFCNISILYLLFHNLRVTFAGQTVSIRHRFFLIPVWYQTALFQDIRTVTVKRTGSTGQGTEKVEHYKIKAATRQGKQLTLARNINGKKTADNVREWLNDRILKPF